MTYEGCLEAVDGCRCAGGSAVKGVPDPCELAFFVEDAEPIIQEVFADRVARTIWLGIKAGHVTSTEFNQNCLTLARWISREDGSVTNSWLTGALQDLGMIGSAEKYGNILAPYINGDKDIRWLERGIEVPA